MKPPGTLYSKVLLSNLKSPGFPYVTDILDLLLESLTPSKIIDGRPT
jgi:hypothetical protein